MRPLILYPFIFLMLVILPLALINFDLSQGEALDKEKAHLQTQEQASRLLDDIGRSATYQIQIRKLIQKFHEEAFHIILRETPQKAGEMLEKLHARTLAKSLPPHDLFVSYLDVFRGKAEIRFRHSAGFGLTEGPVEALAEGIALSRPKVTTSPSYLEDIRRIFHFPFSWDNYSTAYANRLEIFPSAEGNRALFFDFFPSQSKSPNQFRGITCLLINPGSLSPGFGPQTLIESWENPDIGVALLPMDNEPPRFSRFFTRFPHLKDRVLEMREQRSFSSDEVVGEHLVCFGKINLAMNIRPVVVHPLPIYYGSQIISTQRAFQIASQLVIFLGSLLVFQLLLTRRTPRIPIGTILLAVFFLVGILPMSGVSVISRYALAEKEQRMRQDSSQLLHQKLLSLDKDVYLKQSIFLEQVRRITRKSENENLLLREEASDKPLDLLASMATGLLQNQKTFRGGMLPGFLIVAGPGNFSRLWAQPQALRQRNQAQDVFDMFLPIAKRALGFAQNRYEGPKPTIEERSTNAADRTPSKMDLQYEVVRDILTEGLGGDVLFNLLHYPCAVNDIKINLSRVFLMQVPFRHQNFPRYSVIWAWDEELLRNATLQDFLEGKNREKDYNLFWVNSESGKLKSYPFGLDDYPDLMDLAERSSALRLPLRVASLPVVMESLPSSFFNLKFFAGRLIGTDSSIELNQAFRLSMATGTILAIGLALLGAAVFMAPLRRILIALKKITEGDFDIQLADASRHDEFGTLAKAFNDMLVGLREKVLLSRFVSSSVQRAVTDAGFQAAAKEGEIRETTIMFSGIHEFDEFKENHTPEEVFELMENHLSAMSEAIGTFGGEISKVMGEKILLVFDHQLLGSGKKAVEAALNVMGRAKEVLEKNPASQLVMGINSGPVIAGIIGSPKVRLDYTVIGDTVNLASRLSLLAHISGGTRVVLSGGVCQFLDHPDWVEKLPFNRVKGKTQEVEAFLLRSAVFTVSRKR